MSWLKPLTHPEFHGGVIVEDHLSYVVHIALVKKGKLKLLLYDEKEMYGKAKLAQRG